MLGAIYATESAAIFEHQVFREVCEELSARRDKLKEGRGLRAFHDLHLNGVEQSHKDGLGGYLADRDSRPVLVGAFNAIDLMESWWVSLLSEVH